MKNTFILLFSLISFSINSQIINDKNKNLELSDLSFLELKSHNIQYIADTIYTQYLGHTDGNNLILLNGEETILWDQNEIKPFPKIKNTRSNLYQIEDKVYYYTIDRGKNISINLEKSIMLDLSKVQSQSRTSYKINYPHIMYSINDSVYIDNFNNPGRKFIHRGGTVMNLNDMYSWIPCKGEDFIYHINDNKVIPEPKPTPYYGLRVFTNNYVLPYRERTEEYDHLLHVYDLNFNILVHYEKGYTMYCTTSDLMILFAKNKPTLGIYKGKIHELPYKIEAAKNIPATDLILLTNYEGKLGVINSEMDLVQPFEYDKCYDKPYTNPHFVLKTKDKAILVDGKGNQPLENEYQNIDIIDDQRLKVVNTEGMMYVIDFNEKDIIPVQKDKMRDYKISITGRTRSLKGIGSRLEEWLYTYEGEFITSFDYKKLTKEEKEKYYSNNDLAMIDDLPVDKLVKINPSMLWSAKLFMKGEIYLSLMDVDRNLIVNWSPYYIRPLSNNTFLVMTESRKYGIFKYIGQN